MKLRPGLILLFLAGTALPVCASLRSVLFSTEPDVIANTDMFERDTPAPSPGHPVYYMAVSRGYRDFGYENAGEKMPESRGVLKMVTKILDSQGYKVADTEHAPTIIILYSWGTFYQNPDPHATQSYVPEMLDFLGAAKSGIRTGNRDKDDHELGSELTALSPDTSTIVGFIPHGMYVITFWAFDFDQARQGVARVLWKTNVSSSTRGFYLPEVLPTMLTVAAPLIGRETRRPIRIDISERYKPRVDLGELQVIDDDVKLKRK